MVRPVLGALILAWLPAATLADHVSEGVPDRLDPAARYVIYLHGLAVENRGPHARTPEGFADHYGVVKVVAQVGSLLAAGVPARNIAVAGFSKGGAITLSVSALAGEADLRYVVMAGCPSSAAGPFGPGHGRFVEVEAPKIRGRMLSIYDEADRVAGSCRSVFERTGPGFRSEEQVLRNGGGHGLFYQPHDAWVVPVSQWLAK
jgi:hypothetical protein